MKLRYQLIVIIVLSSCVKSYDFTIPDNTCNNNTIRTKSVLEIFNHATNTATKYVNDDSIEAYVISSDQDGNFFKKLTLQTLDGSLGFTIAVDQTDLYTMYNSGRKLNINLMGIYTKIGKGGLELGDLYIDTFNNETVGRIAYPKYENILIKSCDVIDENSLVNNIQLSDISDAYLNTLVEFTNVQFSDEALASRFHNNTSDDEFATNHLIQDVHGNSLIFRTSAFADFAKIEVPNNSGNIRGVLTKFDGDYQLIVRYLSDVNLTKERFIIELKNNILITELADPDNNSGARFIEIYNAENEPINLNGWTIRRYTNANTTVSSTIDLSGQTIQAGQAFVIAANATEFETVYGFAPDLAANSNSAAGSNGDDNIELVDSEGTVVDIFGVIGEDGSATNHEFEDGRAFRNNSIVFGQPIFVFSEWQIWNDTGSNGTINKPQIAPMNYTPGVR